MSFGCWKLTLKHACIFQLENGKTKYGLLVRVMVTAQRIKLPDHGGLTTPESFNNHRRPKQSCSQVRFLLRGSLKDCSHISSYFQHVNSQACPASLPPSCCG